MNLTRQAAAWLALLFSGAALLAAIAAAAEDPPHPEPAPGQLLIASSAIKDPRFHRSVILLISHDTKGAFGIIVNRPLGERPLARVLADARDETGRNPKDAAIEGTIRVFYGGPVQPQYGFVVHSTDYRRPESRIVDDLAMTATKDILRDIGRSRGPAKYLFALGYAGWGAGQLAGEMARRDWFTAPADPDLVFDAERSVVWEKAVARRTRDL